MMNREEFLHLYEKCQTGSCSDEEIELLATYNDELRLADPVWKDTARTEHEVYSRIWDKLLQSRYPNVPLKKNHYKAWLKAAAILFITAASLWILVIPRKSARSTTSAKLQQQPSAIKPGGNKAVLTLANGSNIILNDAKNGSLTKQSGVQVTKADEGIVVYQPQQKELAPAKDEINMISTPRGGQYRLILSDGTKVWLNAASVLKFPAQFAGKERRVELEGEAYFEVQKNPSLPFIVHTSSQDIKVLGTHFNIRAYHDEHIAKTSLLEGRVTVSSSGETRSLVPGFEATSTRNGSLKVQEADLDLSIAWKNGLFQFNQATIEEVMQQVSRWYDVDVIIAEAPLPRRQFTGTISRQVPISEILAMLRYTGVTFDIRGKQILIRK
jgi:transmembrane sensor